MGIIRKVLCFALTTVVCIVSVFISGCSQQKIVGYYKLIETNNGDEKEEYNGSIVCYLVLLEDGIGYIDSEVSDDELQNMGIIQQYDSEHDYFILNWDESKLYIVNAKSPLHRIDDEVELSYQDNQIVIRKGQQKDRYQRLNKTEEAEYRKKQ